MTRGRDCVTGAPGRDGIRGTQVQILRRGVLHGKLSAARQPGRWRRVPQMPKKRQRKNLAWDVHGGVDLERRMRAGISYR